MFSQRPVNCWGTYVGQNLLKWPVYMRRHFRVTGQQITSTAETLTLHPSSKITKENLDVFCEAWESQSSDMSTLLINQWHAWRKMRGEVWLPFISKASEEQRKPEIIKARHAWLRGASQDSKLGLKLGLLTLCETSNANSKTERWQDQENEIVQYGWNMSSMAYSIYLLCYAMLC